MIHGGGYGYGCWSLLITEELKLRHDIQETWNFAKPYKNFEISNMTFKWRTMLVKWHTQQENFIEKMSDLVNGKWRNRLFFRFLLYILKYRFN